MTDPDSYEDPVGKILHPELEADIQKNIMLSAPGFVRLFRNQVGTYALADGRTISSGMGKSTSDLVGWRTITITQEMVGTTIAQFGAVEVKRPGFRFDKRAEEQMRFIRVVKQAGGWAGMVTSVEQAQKLFYPTKE